MYQLFFDNLIRTTTSTGSFSLSGVLISFGLAIIAGLLIALAYVKQGSGTKNFAVALTLLPAVVALLILMVNGNLGAGVAVAGTFGLIRFRSAVGSARDIVLIFLSTAVGIACGMGYAVIGVTFAVIMCLLFLLLCATSFGENKKSDYRELRLMLPENLDYTSVFEDVFAEYTKSVSTTRVRTTNLGSMFEITYNIRLKNPAREKEFIDKLRTRNGNLTIVCARTASVGEKI